MEVILPLPKDIYKRKEISESIKLIVDKKTEIRTKIQNLTLDSFEI
jgi:hypothetical protein